MPKTPMRDIVIFIPGIMGSVLQRGGKDLWAVSGRALWDALKSFGGSLENLTLGEDDLSRPEVDGISAPRLMDDVHMIPGFWKIDGYSGVREMFEKNFTLTPGDINVDDGGQSNYFELPYDWRRDNRAAARRLAQVVDDKLTKWGQYSGATDAKVIIVAHSMGGLVARYYLEVLGGWRRCKLLLTFGTPHRGSVKALDFIVNGYKKAVVDMSAALRSFNSIYQLLPLYRVIDAGGRHHRAAAFARVPAFQEALKELGADASRVVAARRFHAEIRDAVKRNRKETAYIEGFKTVPIVGVWQPTLLSASLSGGKLKALGTFGDASGQTLEDGDGTVPYQSAVPLEFSGDYQVEHPFPEQHGSLQNNEQVRAYFYNLLRRSQTKIANFWGTEGTRPDAGGRPPGIGLDLEDLYVAGLEPVSLSARVVGEDGQTADAGGLVAEISSSGAVVPPETPADGLRVIADGAAADVKSEAGVLKVTAPFREDGGRWTLALEGLPPGVYRVKVSGSAAGVEAPSPVKGLFEVAPEPARA